MRGPGGAAIAGHQKRALFAEQIDEGRRGRRTVTKPTSLILGTGNSQRAQTKHKYPRQVFPLEHVSSYTFWARLRATQLPLRG